MEREFKEIPLSDIVLSGDNKRKFDKKPDVEDVELTESIKAGGVRLPIQVRVHPEKKGKYELRYGERRFRASKAAGMETIPALVSDKLSEEDAFDLTYIENKFRKDLKPLEEAAEVALLMERFGGDVKAITKRYGINAQWVYVRANIAKGLIKPWREYIEGKDGGKIAKSWSLSHLSLIARLPKHIQQSILEEVEDDPWEYETLSAADLDEMIGKMLHLLSKARWVLDDETLIPKAGACSKCPKRCGHQPMLWFDSDDQVEAGDQCLDGLCWQSKEMAWLERRAAELRQNHPKLVLAMTEPTRSVNQEAITEKLGTPIAPWQYKTCSKTTKGAVPAMYINNKGAGKLTYIKINEFSSASAGKPKGVPTPLKQRQAMLDAKRWAQVLLDLRDKVEETKVSELCLDDRVTGLMALVALYGNKVPWQARADVKHEEAEQLIKSGRKKVLETLWQTFSPTLDELLAYNGPITQTPKRFVTDSEWIAKLISANLKAMFNDVSSRKGFTVPKSWAGLNADGTPKKVKPAKAKKSKTNKSKTEKVA